MEENQKDADGTDVPYTEEEDTEESTAQCPPVSELVVHDSLGDIPAYKQTGEEATDGQHNLSGNEVEPVEEWLSVELQHIDMTQW